MEAFGEEFLHIGPQRLAVKGQGEGYPLALAK
jgi:hypothetical protein